MNVAHIVFAFGGNAAWEGRTIDAINRKIAADRREFDPASVSRAQAERGAAAERYVAEWTPEHAAAERAKREAARERDARDVDCSAVLSDATRLDG